mmetsp:Transcript_50174/g.93955  ORF Transcript_50174/g.93955 Transcript_50174/m.93955 type:complete len:370 (-) Transcript_50174:116-1225(-)
MAMHRLAFAVACLACASHGRRVQEEARAVQLHPLKTLAALLRTVESPSAGWQTTGLGHSPALKQLTSQPVSVRSSSLAVSPTMKADFSEVGSSVLPEGSIQGERYIASNRFFVKKGKEPAFEKRWATRKSRLAVLDGFNFFALMRRVDPVENEPNYVSFTVWDDKDTFTAWRKGEAFKEAHGGGTLWGFVSMMVSSTQTLKGAPKPAFYDGLLPIAPPVEKMPESVDGWRSVPADGINTLKAEVFVAQNRFKIAPGSEVAFEQRWQKRESKLRECDGFVSFYMMRRDATKADDGYNYVSTTVWRDRAAFDAWRAQQTSSHGQGEGKGKGPPATGMMQGPPSVALYEGVLSLYAPDYNTKASAKREPVAA